MALTLSGDDGVAGVNGSATTPAIQGTDTNTGLTFGTDTVNVVTGGSTRATVDSSGRVGIGTSTLTNVLHVHQTDATANSYVHITQADGGSGATDGLSIGIEDGGVNAVIRNRENGFLRMYTNDTEQARITSGGDFRFNSGFGSVTTVYGIRAWARIDGTGTISTYGSGGFDVITDQGTGLYRFNFENSMPDTNYAVAGSTDGNTIFQVTTISATNWAQTNIQTTSATAADSDDVSIMVVR